MDTPGSPPVCPMAVKKIQSKGVTIGDGRPVGHKLTERDGLLRVMGIADLEIKVVIDVIVQIETVLLPELHEVGGRFVL